MRIIISLPSPILTHLAVRIHVFLKCLETLRECCVSTKPCFILLFSVLSLRLRRYLVSILKLAIGVLTSGSFRELLNHKEILGKRKKEGKKTKSDPPPNLILLSKQRKLLHSLLQKAHRHLDWNLYTKTIREFPTSYDRSLGFNNFTTFWDHFSIR